MAADEIVTLAVNENLHNLRKEAAKNTSRTKGLYRYKTRDYSTIVCKTRDYGMKD